MQSPTIETHAGNTIKGTNSLFQSMRIARANAKMAAKTEGGAARSCASRDEYPIPSIRIMGRK
jgi:hypothetical protein